MSVLVAPSLLSADFNNLEKEVEMINNSEADWFHMDVMDGVFVPNISFGFPVIKAVSRIAKKPLDVHLMIVNPERYIQQTADAGAMMMTVHQEACTHLHRIVQQIHQAGMKAGVALNPATSISTLEDIINDVDMVLLMSVNPGFGGQQFIEGTIDKLLRLQMLMDRQNAHPPIEIDGGVDNVTAPRLIQAGANILVSGSYVFKAKSPLEAIKSLKI